MNYQGDVQFFAPPLGDQGRQTHLVLVVLQPRGHGAEPAGDSAHIDIDGEHVEIIK